MVGDGSAIVQLRRASPNDAYLIAAWRAEPSAARFQPLRQRSLEEIRENLRERAEQRLDRQFDGKAQWIVEVPHGPVGWVTLRVVSHEHRIADVGYTITETARGNGYATAAVRQVVELAFAEEGLDLERLQAVAAVENGASRRVLERVGFQFEGILRGYLIIGGRRVDHATYGLLRM